MGYKCERCNQLVNKLVRLDDAQSSATYTELLNTPYESYTYVCINCALEQLGINTSDFVGEELQADQGQFLLNIFKGGIAQFIVKTVLQYFGYEVFPYGYENYLSTISRTVSTSNFSVSSRRIRSTPDLFVFDPKSKDSFLVEVKSTSVKDESCCLISKSKLDDYCSYWSEAILIMYCVHSGNMYCKKISDLDLNKLRKNSAFGQISYELNLTSFQRIYDIFNVISAEYYHSFYARVLNVLKQFGNYNFISF